MKSLIPWLGAACIIIIVFSAMYGAVQQVQRTDANWPQIQVAEDTATSLDQGNPPANLTASGVHIASSLAAFTIIYSKAGAVVSSSGYVNGQVPVAPLGMLQAANGTSYHTVTWQPELGVRIAAVTVAANNYYVLSGRSLQVVEENENSTLKITALGAVASLSVLVVVCILTKAFDKTPSSRRK